MPIRTRNSPTCSGHAWPRSARCAALAASTAAPGSTKYANNASPSLPSRWPPARSTASRHQRVMLGQHPGPRRTGRARQPRRALDVGEQHRHDTLGRTRRIADPTSIGVERRVVAQDRLLQALQLRRGLEPELLIQPPPPARVDLERVALAPAAIQRQHQQADQPLTRRILGAQLLELGDHKRVLAVGQPRIDALLQRGDAQLLQPRDLCLRERLKPHIGQRRPTPEPQRVIEQPPRRRLIAPHTRRPRLTDQRLEAPRVDSVGLDHEPITRRNRLQRRTGGTERAPQPRHRHLQATQRLRRRRPRPKRLGRRPRPTPDAGPVPPTTPTAPAACPRERRRHRRSYAPRPSRGSRSAAPSQANTTPLTPV